MKLTTKFGNIWLELNGLPIDFDVIDGMENFKKEYPQYTVDWRIIIKPRVINSDNFVGELTLKTDVLDKLHFDEDTGEYYQANYSLINNDIVGASGFISDCLNIDYVSTDSVPGQFLKYDNLHVAAADQYKFILTMKQADQVSDYITNQTVDMDLVFATNFHGYEIFNLSNN